jgi:hypothetical protein
LGHSWASFLGFLHDRFIKDDTTTIRTPLLCSLFATAMFTGETSSSQNGFRKKRSAFGFPSLEDGGHSSHKPTPDNDRRGRCGEFQSYTDPKGAWLRMEALSTGIDWQPVHLGNLGARGVGNVYLSSWQRFDNMSLGLGLLYYWVCLTHHSISTCNNGSNLALHSSPGLHTTWHFSSALFSIFLRACVVFPQPTKPAGESKLIE